MQVGCSFLLLLGLTGAADAARPNFVLILADDLGYGDLGCYGNTVNRTPHLDRLAREGMRFVDFHANGANCSPTRAALLTGRYQQRTGIEGALGEGAPGLAKSEVTIADRLRQAGYATALIGKWHLGYFPNNGPVHHGFDQFAGHLHGATDYISHVDRYGRMDWWHNDRPVGEEGYNTTLITDHAIRFIRGHRRQPLFLMVSHSAIHFPWMTPDDKAHRVAGTRHDDVVGKLGPHVGGPVQPVVQRMIEELDGSVGRIMGALKELELDSRTLVFFTSDNGGILRQAGVAITPGNRISSNAPLRGQKHGLYEGGHRVPAIAWWPGRVPRGVQSAATAMTMDLHPTWLDLAGLDLPAAGGPHALDGISLRSELLGRGATAERILFWRQGDSTAVRWRTWKLVSIHGRPFELYDLNKDLGERHDLARQHPEIVQKLSAALDDWQRTIGRERRPKGAVQSAPV